MAHLPDDILLVIFACADIDTLLNLRLLDHNIRALIQTHIHGLTESVARSSFPKQNRILTAMPSKDSEDRLECLRWLKELRYQQLAAIPLEYDESPVSAEDVLGEPLAQGWRILAQCSKIAREVSEIPGEQLSRLLPAPDPENDEQEATVASTRLRELETCRRCLAHLETLPTENLQAYQQLRMCVLESVLGFPSKFTTELLSQEEPGNIPCRSWVASYILKLGPESFWKAWWATQPTSGQDTYALGSVVEAAWDKRNEATRREERQIDEILREQVEYITSRARERLWTPSRAQRRMPEDVHNAFDLPEAGIIAHERASLTAKGQLPPPRVLNGLRFEQRLDTRVIGRTPTERSPRSPPRPASPPPPPHAPPQQRVSVCFPSGSHRTPFDDVLPEYKNLYVEWKREWREKQGWEVQLQFMRQRLEQA
ncbi:hypothetical protein LTR53_003731 [Teratosphaeriaceae sp. CCFEE 6253]|nr:hypothetical protein LTR53_003731 [Teratosphaeriaceae sp. CCFEE 6253]